MQKLIKLLHDPASDVSRKEAINGLEYLIKENSELERLHAAISIQVTQRQHKIDKLTAENSALHTELDDAYKRFAVCIGERDAYQTAYGKCDEICDDLLIENKLLHERHHNSNEILTELKNTIARARGCIIGLINRTPIRDLDETLAELTSAIEK